MLTRLISAEIYVSLCEFVSWEYCVVHIDCTLTKR